MSFITVSSLLSLIILQKKIENIMFGLINFTPFEKTTTAYFSFITLWITALEFQLFLS